MSTTNHDASPLEPLVRSIEAAEVVDAPAGMVSDAAKGLLGPGRLKDALSGTWLGHALHPALTDVVIGCFLSASVLDLVGGEESDPAAQRLIMAGIAAYGPTAAAGASDWVDGAVDDRVKRVGIVHAAGNAVALGLYVTSLRARRRGSRGVGRLAALAGGSVLMLGGYLGGHLSLRRGIGPDQTVFDPGSQEWSRATEISALGDGQPARVIVGDTPILLVKTGESIHAIHDRCSHRGCSLSEGELEGTDIVCGCHSSRFDLRTGSVLNGPATAPQPAFEVRVEGDEVQVRLRAAG